jgi:hypothetical protein
MGWFVTTALAGTFFRLKTLWNDPFVFHGLAVSWSVIVFIVTAPNPRFWNGLLAVSSRNVSGHLRSMDESQMANFALNRSKVAAMGDSGSPPHIPCSPNSCLEFAFFSTVTQAHVQCRW